MLRTGLWPALRRLLFAVVVMTACVGCGQRVVVTVHEYPSDHQGTHAKWDHLVSTVVDAQGRVDFEQVAQREPELDQVLAAIGALPAPEDPAACIAWQLNAYHAMGMKAVLIHGYPESIDAYVDRASFFGYTKFLVAGVWRSLQDQLKDGVLAQHDPRVVGSLSGMTHGFPRLSDRAFDPATIDRDLAAGMRALARDSRFVRIDAAAERLVLSPLLRRVEGMLTRDGVDMVEWLNSWRQEPLPAYPITWSAMDWQVIHAIEGVTEAQR